MSIRTKLAAVALAAVTFAGSVTAFTSEAQAGPRWGAAVGAGIAAGLILGAAAAHAPAYSYGYKRCHWVRNYDAYGYYIGKSRVCRYY